MVKSAARSWRSLSSVINNIEQVFNDPQVKARNMKIDLPHTVVGSVPGVANPLKFSETETEYHKAPPLHGEDIDQVLGEILGYSESELVDLRDQKII